jgi:hypothetical protein
VAFFILSVIVGRTNNPVRLTTDGDAAYAQFSGRTVQLSSAVNRQLKFKTIYIIGNKSRGNCKEIRPALPNLLKACKAENGSYWAIQRWQRLKANFGGTTATPELHISHWTRQPPVIYGFVECGAPLRIKGRFIFHGVPVFGYKHTPQGVPLDPYGRNIYLDTFLRGKWQRENSFLTKPPDGGFSYAFWKSHRIGTKFRLSAIGPGVTPVVETVLPMNC